MARARARAEVTDLPGQQRQTTKAQPEHVAVCDSVIERRG
jgi:hypothetical protein